MRVGIVTAHGPSAASSRIRMFGLAESLRLRGTACRTMIWGMRPGARGSRAALASRLMWLGAHSDVLVLQKASLPKALLSAVRRQVGAIVCDYDDASWIPPLPHSAQKTATYEVVRARVAHAVRLADRVVVGSTFLARWIEEDFAPRSAAVTIPTGIDLSKYVVKQHSGGERLRVGWIGSPSNHADLLTFWSAVSSLRAESLSLVVISATPERLPITPDEFILWSERSEGTALQKVDIGIMPLRDEPRSRGRCGFKALQYMASGLPVVASAVGGASEPIEDGITGALVRSSAGWIPAINLFRNPSVRNEAGTAGRNRVERDYSTTRMLQEYAALLENLVAAA